MLATGGPARAQQPGGFLDDGVYPCPLLDPYHDVYPYDCDESCHVPRCETALRQRAFGENVTPASHAPIDVVDDAPEDSLSKSQRQQWSAYFANASREIIGTASSLLGQFQQLVVGQIQLDERIESIAATLEAGDAPSLEAEHAVIVGNMTQLLEDADQPSGQVIADRLNALGESAPATNAIASRKAVPTCEATQEFEGHADWIGGEPPFEYGYSYEYDHHRGYADRVDAGGNKGSDNHGFDAPCDSVCDDFSVPLADVAPKQNTVATSDESPAEPIVAAVDEPAARTIESYARPCFETIIDGPARFLFLRTEESLLRAATASIKSEVAPAVTSEFEHTLATPAARQKVDASVAAVGIAPEEASAELKASVGLEDATWPYGYEDGCGWQGCEDYPRAVQSSPRDTQHQQEPAQTLDIRPALRGAADVSARLLDQAADTLRLLAARLTAGIEASDPQPRPSGSTSTDDWSDEADDWTDASETEETSDWENYGNQFWLGL
jgi:hypothetical protein